MLQVTQASSTWKRSTDVTNTVTMSVHSAKLQQPNVPVKWSSSGSKCQNKRRRSSFTTHMHSQFRENPSNAALQHTNGRHRVVAWLSGSAATCERCALESASHHQVAAGRSGQRMIYTQLRRVVERIPVCRRVRPLAPVAPPRD